MQKPTFDYEKNLIKQGYRHVAGVDEAGRGPLAGPVVAAAVILPLDIDLPRLAGVQDSKQLSESARQRSYQIIKECAIAYSIAQASAREIETLDIRQASLLAMKRAVEKISPQPDAVVVDGRDAPSIDCFIEPVIKGDQKSLSISAASIMAKVVRDRMMVALHHKFPHYGLDHHKGYPTKFHKTAIRLFGTTPHHRNTYAGVAENTLVADPSTPFQERFKKLLTLHKEDEIQFWLKELQEINLIEDERFYLQHRAQFTLQKIKDKKRVLSPSTRDKGTLWEQKVIEHLEEQGYILWEQNYRGKHGEIDIIVNQGTYIVFIEVKMRRSRSYGKPYEAVTKKKRNAIIKTAEEYLYERDLMTDWDLRYDVISVEILKGHEPDIVHIEDAFRVEEDFS